MIFWLVVLAVGAVLFALAWWSSGRSKHRIGRPDARAEANRGWATHQNGVHNDGMFGGPS
jgi:Flp pilus assembly protein TadB